MKFEIVLEKFICDFVLKFLIKFCSLDLIFMGILKEYVDLLVIFIINIINEFFSFGVFLDLFKEGVVFLFFKKFCIDWEVFVFYRFIINIFFLFKLFE